MDISSTVLRNSNSSELEGRNSGNTRTRTEGMSLGKGSSAMIVVCSCQVSTCCSSRSNDAGTRRAAIPGKRQQQSRLHQQQGSSCCAHLGLHCDLSDVTLTAAPLKQSQMRQKASSLPSSSSPPALFFWPELWSSASSCVLARRSHQHSNFGNTWSFSRSDLLQKNPRH